MTEQQIAGRKCNDLQCQLIGAHTKDCDIRTLRAQVEELDKKWHEERSSHLHYKEIAELYGQQRDALAQPIPIRHELEVWLCPVHASLDEDGILASLDNCVACIRVERDELRKRIAELERLLAEARGDVRKPREVNYPYDFTTHEVSGWWIVDKRYPGSRSAHTNRSDELNFIVNALNDAARERGQR